MIDLFYLIFSLFCLFAQRAPYSGNSVRSSMPKRDARALNQHLVPVAVKAVNPSTPDPHPRIIHPVPLQACGFDGGDCCECTCVDGSNASCEESVFFCVDPSAPCYDPDAAVVKSTCMSEDIGKIGNGYCDFSIDSSADDNNNEAST